MTDGAGIAERQDPGALDWTRAAETASVVALDGEPIEDHGTTTGWIVDQDPAPRCQRIEATWAVARDEGILNVEVGAVDEDAPAMVAANLAAVHVKRNAVACCGGRVDADAGRSVSLHGQSA